MHDALAAPSHARPASPSLDRLTILSPRDGRVVDAALLRRPDGRRLLFKRASPEVAIAAARLARFLGVVTPPVRRARLRGIEGIVQPWMEPTVTAFALEMDEPRSFARVEAAPWYREQLAAMQALDIVIRNLDRNPSNWLLELDQLGEPARLIAVDHKLCFSTATDVEALAAPAAVSRRTLSRLRALALPGGVERLAGGLLSPDQTEACRLRARALVEELDSRP